MAEMKKILITGAAGFIGSNLAEYWLEKGAEVIGIDNLNDYYDVKLKQARLQKLESYKNFLFSKADIADMDVMRKIFKEKEPEIVVNLAAQAGVRYSIENPDSYIQSNLIGFYNILECCRHSYDDGKKGVEHLVYVPTFV